ncbi:enoyl-CoA hydratase domain-containing protein 3, mitochondrial [Lycorma delicatula]|uniref:enoyl-CoA hydratase domain-containing protein 3, mitochondrial n=1 Tax=Lycorma delicatula TaxID=130591 RepID=UPI003F517509
MNTLAISHSRLRCLKMSVVHLKQIRLFSTTNLNCGELTKTQEENGIRRIILNNPKSRNALCMTMMNELLDHISLDLNNISLRCIVISAEGPVFSSGHNLKELILENKDYKSKEIFSLCSVLMKRIMEVPVPVIAAVQGPAVAAGCQLVAQCDIAVCTENSIFSTPGSHFGIFCSTPGIPLVRTVPRKIAAHMLMTGEPIKAEEALRVGLVSNVVPSDQLESEVMKICNAIKSQSKSVVALGKRFFYEQLELDIHTAYRLGENVMDENVQLIDGQEGIRSFAEKRKPVWKHNFDKLFKA